MNHNIKQAFSQIQAQPSLKAQTKQVILERAHKPTYPRTLARFATTAAVFAVGYWAFFIPVSSISIDVNPSLELAINRFDRVVGIQAYNEEAENLIQSLDIRFETYPNALDEILSSEQIESYLTQEEIVSVTVAGKNEQVNAQMLDTVQQCTAQHQNISCHAADSHTIEQAHHAGLSVGKYQLVLQIQQQNPDFTTEQAQGMTMRELQNLLEPSEPGQPSGTGNGSGYGSGNGNGQQSGTGTGNGAGYGNGNGHGTHHACEQ